MIPAIDLTNEAGEVITSLRLTTAAMVKLERKFSAPIQDVATRLETKPSIELIADFAAAMMDGGKGVSEEEAFECLDNAGGVLVAGPTISEAVSAAFPDAEEEEARGAAGNVPKRRKKPPK